MLEIKENIKMSFQVTSFVNYYHHQGKPSSTPDTWQGHVYKCLQVWFRNHCLNSFLHTSVILESIDSVSVTQVLHLYVKKDSNNGFGSKLVSVCTRGRTKCLGCSKVSLMIALITLSPVPVTITAKIRYTLMSIIIFKQASKFRNTLHCWQSRNNREKTKLNTF